MAEDDPSTTARREVARPSRGSRRDRPASGTCSPAALLGLLRNDTVDRLTPTHKVKDGRRIRYYVSHRLITGPADRSGWRLPGPALERAVAGVLAEHLESAVEGHALLAMPDIHWAPALREAVMALVGGLREERVPDVAQPASRA